MITVPTLASCDVRMHLHATRSCAGVRQLYWPTETGCFLLCFYVCIYLLITFKSKSLLLIVLGAPRKSTVVVPARFLNRASLRQVTKRDRKRSRAQFVG